LGEFANSVVLAKVKIYSQGRMQEIRYVLSTFIGQIFDNSFAVLSLVFVLELFSKEIALELIITSVVATTAIEVVMLPVTKKVVHFIKNNEGLDTYDIGTNFNPFKLR
jgi:uncharacterized PurR-regulated membrane protein YhhQ (DUF165 family)